VTDFTSAILLFVVFLYSTVCHEAAHAWVAHKLGDDTAKLGGQVSLDPIPHIKRAPIGMVVLPLIMLMTSGGRSLMGWGLAPYNPDWARRNPVKDAWVAVAGPAAKLILILISAITIRVFISLGYFDVPHSIGGLTTFATATTGSSVGMQAFATTMGTVFSMNLLLFAFNLIPLPPLDGSKIPLFFIRGTAANSYQEFLQNPSIAFVTMLVAFNGFGPIFMKVKLFAISLLYPGAFA
jgi:Zn-dependent protease